MGFILFVVATVIKLTVGIPAWIYGLIASLFKGEFNKYYFNLALATDQYGNALCKYLFDSCLITKHGYKFGNMDETISSVIGKNKEMRTLTFLGRFLDTVLDILDDNHSIKSIDKNVEKLDF